MNTIFNDAVDKNVAVRILYASAGDAVLTYDKEGSEKVATKEDLFNLYLKGIVVVVTDEYFRPVAYKEDGGAGKITVVHENIEAAEFLDFYSAEHEG